TMIEDEIVPVELTNFSARINEGSVELNWETSTETNNLGFIIERKMINQNEDWREIGFAEGKGTVTEINKYSFIDNPTLNGIYHYRLKQVDFDGTFEYSKEVEVNINVINDFALMQNYPNPFNPTTIISYQLAFGTHVSLKIYDVLGNEIATLVNEKREAGEHEVEFQSSVDSWQLANGVYFYKLQTEDYSSVKKMVYLK
ncbi:MAG TPA: T9SS type A sorting domain-containing protein, partial [Ignavibacteriaceae bacterium]|nr:T9SS type A sorting domain-containing protein [Ignavibacteriaceae bacterium]